MKLIKYLSSQVPLDSKLKVVMGGAVYAGVFNPTKYSVLGFMLHKLSEEGSWINNFTLVQHGLEYGLYLTTATGLALLGAKLIDGITGGSKLNAQKIKPPEREVYLGNGMQGMTFAENDLFTNVMITGAIGSGKTSSAIYPILEQLLKLYSVEDSKTHKDDPYQKLGGLVLDVKGDFYEALVWLMHRAGRDVLNDLVVITPFCEYAYLQLIDPETGRHFFVSARGGGDVLSNETTYLFDGYFMPDEETLEADIKSPIAVNLFTDARALKRRIGAHELTYEQYVKDLTIDVTKKKINFIGWRYEPDGKTLRRVLYTNNKKETIWAKDSEGNPIYAQAPKNLKFKRVRSVNNGLTFNICPPSLGPAELASRITSMSKSASGSSGGGGENSFWDDATKKHVGWCVQLLREVEPEKEVTAIDLNQMTTNEDRIDEETGKLAKVIDKKTGEINLAVGGEKLILEEELKILKDMQNYFESQWKDLDQRTKSNLQATITNLFGTFMSDPKLRRVFCVPSSFKIEEVMRSGKVFTLVAPEYESAARVFGTALKLEFQALLRRRPAQSNFNKMRFILFMCDEAQNYVTAGGSDNSGDENFMALSRQSRVCNIIATQSDSSIINVIGEKSAPVYYQGFGSRIWYQNLDLKTNDLASKILGKKKVEKRSSSGDDFTMGSLMSKDSKGPSYNVSEDTKERFPPETFSGLNVHEGVMFNKGKKGKKEKVTKVQLKPHFVGDPKRRDEKNGIIRWYFQAYIENRLNALKEFSNIDTTEEGAAAVSVVQAEEKRTVSYKGKSPTGAVPPVAAGAGVEEFNTQEAAGSPTVKPGENVFGWKKASVAVPKSALDTDLTASGVGEDMDENLEQINEHVRDKLPESVKEALQKVNQEPEIFEEELDAITSTFGGATKIGERIKNYVNLLDETTMHVTTDFEDEPSPAPATAADVDGTKLVGDDADLFNPSDDFKRRKDGTKQEKKEEKPKAKVSASDLYDDDVPSTENEDLVAPQHVQDIFKDELDILGDEVPAEPEDSLKDLMLDE